ncbi:hypothetical protein V9K67_03005 [Paraflavisolibacter sp. H34]|uniref:hypothetical protein n=1 Tax=Huijunlia imazamoxiresistens TaxID=3127457 RepID=UPI003018A56B
MHNYLIYRAYGRLEYMHECRYSLLKYLSVYNLHPPADTAVVIYTDHPDLFEAYIPFFPHFQLQELAGSEAFGPKPDFARYLSATYQGNVLYCDTDTYFALPPKPVFEKIKTGSFCLHGRTEAAPDLAPYQHLLAGFVPGHNGANGKKHASPAGQPPLYRTHALGFRHTDKSILNNVSTLHEVLKGQVPGETSEQMAFGFFLQSHKVHTLQDAIHSYRDFPEFKKLLHIFFQKNAEESVPNLVKLAHHLDLQGMKKEKAKFDSLPLLKKWLSRLTGKGWSIRQYQNKI